jgi:hypothetical protein
MIPTTLLALFGAKECSGPFSEGPCPHGALVPVTGRACPACRKVEEQTMRGE